MICCWKKKSRTVPVSQTDVINQSEEEVEPQIQNEPSFKASESEPRKDPRKEALRRTNFRMINDITDVQGVLDYIHSKTQIPKNIREDIMAETVRNRQARKLLSLLETLGDDGYDIFRDALLSTDQPHLANILPAFGKLRFLLGNVSQLQTNIVYLGDVCRIAGASWRLEVRVIPSHGSRIVGIFLKYEPRDSGEERFLVKREFTLVRQNPKRGMEDIVKRAATIFPDPINGCTSMGPDMIGYDFLTDPRNDWLQNDSMRVLAALEIEKISLGERTEGSLNFVLNDVREIVLDALYCSDPHVVCGVRWRIVLYAHMKEGKKYFAVGIHGMEEDFNGRRYHITHKSTLVRQSGSQPNLVDEGVCVLPGPWSGSTNSVHTTFIPFDQLIDPQHGWLNNNSLEVSCDLTLMQLQDPDF